MWLWTGLFRQAGDLEEIILSQALHFHTLHLLPKAIFLKLQYSSEHWASPREFWCSRSWWGLRICFSEFPGDADAVDLGHAFWKALEKLSFPASTYDSTTTNLNLWPTLLKWAQVALWGSPLDFLQHLQGTRPWCPTDVWTFPVVVFSAASLMFSTASLNLCSWVVRGQR